MQLLDICLPGYFQGHHKTVLQVPVWRDMTKAELTEAIVDEYNMAWEHYVEFGDWPDLTSEQLRAECDDFILSNNPLKYEPIPTLEDYETDLDLESVYAYLIYPSE